MATQTETHEAPDGDVVTSTTATSSTPSTETKTEPANPDRSNTEQAGIPTRESSPSGPVTRGEIEPNKKG